MITLRDRIYWWWLDVWLTIRYGKWVVVREFSHYERSQPGFGMATVKAEGSTIPYDNGRAVYHYHAFCRRTLDQVHCLSKREAEGVVAINNDSRGLDDGVNRSGC